MKKLIIEGVDNTGKSTLIDYLRNNQLKGFTTVHMTSPPRSVEDPVYYQQQIFDNFMTWLRSPAYMIFDRAHLGEYIYGPLYRGSDGNFVFDYEVQKLHYNHLTEDVRMVLIITSNFDVLVDDGRNINKDNERKEQGLFIEAFNKSHLQNKVMVDIMKPDGTRKTVEELAAEVMKGQTVT